MTRDTEARRQRRRRWNMECWVLVYRTEATRTRARRGSRGAVHAVFLSLLISLCTGWWPRLGRAGWLISISFSLACFSVSNSPCVDFFSIVLGRLAVVPALELILKIASDFELNFFTFENFFFLFSLFFSFPGPPGLIRCETQQS